MWTQNYNSFIFCQLKSHWHLLLKPWWRHKMETFSALLAICAGNSQRPVTRSFDVFFDLCPNKPLSKQAWGWRFETLSFSLWRHCNVCITLQHIRMWSEYSMLAWFWLNIFYILLCITTTQTKIQQSLNKIILCYVLWCSKSFPGAQGRNSRLMLLHIFCGDTRYLSKIVAVIQSSEVTCQCWNLACWLVDND